MKRLKKITRKPFRALAAHLKTVPADHNTEALHEIRVDIKKIKSVLKLIEESRKKFGSRKHFLPFRAIFRKADAIRQPEVLAGLLSKYPEEQGQLPPVDHPPLETFESNVPEYLDTVKAESKKLKPYLKKIDRRDIGRYLKHQYKKIKSSLYPHFVLNDIHKTRKFIKAALFIAEPTDHIKKKKEKFYNKLQEIIGELHDKQLLLQALKKNDDSRQNHRAIRTASAHDIRQIRRLVADFYG